jgi:hypothetical protein
MPGKHFFPIAGDSKEADANQARLLCHLISGLSAGIYSGPTLSAWGYGFRKMNVMGKNTHHIHFSGILTTKCEQLH